MVAKGNYLCEVFEKKVPIIIQAQMGKLTNCIFLLFDGTNVHVPIPIAILPYVSEKLGLEVGRPF